MTEDQGGLAANWRLKITKLMPPPHECVYENFGAGDSRELCVICGEFRRPDDALQSGGDGPEEKPT